jgi:hypothetical protein
MLLGLPRLIGRQYSRARAFSRHVDTPQTRR